MGSQTKYEMHFEGLEVERGEVSVGEEDLPGGVEIEPALRAVPTGGDLGYVEQAVASGADEFGAVPGEEVA